MYKSFLKGYINEINTLHKFAIFSWWDAWSNVKKVIVPP